MPISLSVGPTAEGAYRAPKVFSLDDYVENDLWNLIGRLKRELPQLRRLGPAAACSDETFSPDEMPALMRDVEYLAAEGSEAGTVLTTRLKQGLRRLQPFLEQANATNSFLHAHIE